MPGTHRVRNPVVPDRLEVWWNPAEPEFVAAANGVSLMMPSVEPCFVRAVQDALRAEPDRIAAELAAEAGWFCAQELAHQSVHRSINAALVAEVPRLAPIERWIGRLYRWITRTRSLRFRLAFAASTEAMAHGMALWVARRPNDMVGVRPGPTAQLFLWHLAEEVEHKAVAHDVWRAIDTSRVRYGFALLWSLATLVLCAVPATFVMLASQRRLRWPVTWWRLTAWALRFLWFVVPVMAGALSRHHDPRRIPDPGWYQALLMDRDLGDGANADGATGRI